MFRSSLLKLGPHLYFQVPSLFLFANELHTPSTEANQSWQCGVEHVWHFWHFGRKGRNPSEKSIGMMFHVAGFSYTDRNKPILWFR